MSARTFVVGDIHGHRKELVAALRANRLVDGDGHWSGGTDTVWFLGDFLDRGPEGIGVIDEVVSLSEQAAEAGGGVHALLGNHEILALGMHRFGETEVPSEFGPRSFARSWQLNGGVGADQEQLTDKRLDWLLKLPVLAVVDDHLLMHSDTVEYLNWGSSVDEINETFAAILASDDISAWWDCWRRMTTRYAFRGIRGGELAGQVLELLGGHQIVHGHSVIAEHLGVLPSQIEAPDLYADGTVLGVDAGLFAGGPCLIVELPYSAESPRRASA